MEDKKNQLNFPYKNIYYIIYQKRTQAVKQVVTTVFLPNFP